MSELVTTSAENFQLRPMYMSDLPKVLKIIDAHDDDDAESAEEDYQNAGFDDQYVYECDDEVIGVTGYREVTATDKTAWLSWTYLKPEFQGRGLGKKMTEQLLQILREKGARKLFVKVSNYQDPEEGDVYARALAMYKSVGFVHELTGHDFYDSGEDQLILGLEFDSLGGADADFPDAGAPTEVSEERPVIRFQGLYEIADTEGAYSFEWFVKPRKGLFEKRNFTTEDLVLGLQAVKAEGGRKVFLTFPSNLVLIHAPLKDAGFKFVGQLQDYYEKGVHEMHFTHDLLM